MGLYSGASDNSNPFMGLYARCYTRGIARTRISNLGYNLVLENSGLHHDKSIVFFEPAPKLLKVSVPLKIHPVVAKKLQDMKWSESSGGGDSVCKNGGSQPRDSNNIMAMTFGEDSLCFEQGNLFVHINCSENSAFGGSKGFWKYGGAGCYKV